MSTTSQRSMLSARYELQRRIHTDPDGVLWRALDTTLDRRVSVRVLRTGHPFAADVADAARRAALVDDPRLVRVLNVGNDDGTGFVVSEDLAGQTLATALERGPLAAPVVRRVIGEVAEGLAGAAERGLHHLRLTPRSIVIKPDGSVKLAGTAVDAAVAGLEPDHAATANRVDAVALAALVYFGLTGRWPLQDSGFPPAPRDDDGLPVPPAELAPDVPNDLDTLCVVTLGPLNDGPRSPADMVRELAPWPSAEEAPVPSPLRLKPVAETPTPVTPGGGTARRTPAGGLTRRTPGESEAGRSAPTPPAGNSPAKAVPPAPKAVPPAPAAHRSPSGAPASPVDGLFAAGAAARSGSTPTAPWARPEPRTPATPPAASAPTRPQPTEGLRPLRPGADTRPPRRPTRVAADSGELLMPWQGAWVDADRGPDPADATGPFPIVIPPEPPPREQSRKVIVGIAGVMVLLLVLAVFSLRNFGGSKDDTSTAIAPLTPASATSAPRASAPAAPAPTQAPATSAPASAPATDAEVKPQVVGVEAVDPQGDGEENDGDAANVLDDRTSTTWQTDSYKSPTFGGLKKGLGLVLKLKRTSLVTSVTVASQGGGTIQLFGSEGPDKDGATKLDEKSSTSDKVKLRGSEDERFHYLIVWFTELPPDGGKYRATVSGIKVQ